ncbi:NAD(P)-binding protein [Cryphonectria parasitica EP155]|uniref:NAD(P)-binding protein n=1 Tax=Cryphonectria parasitica (strain ATCC 38755 / EP155) TaxID=660469 RepID=A0A9P4XUG2_CRYP1|nr:NAD(P)-binding protein [Cryphonectria parasitica EP155]KAF3761007.1 NAD(P)-binding protein [Cryphonectria parasitica EP155]
MDIKGYAFVTGEASGIGRAFCLAFAKEGARGVIVADLNAEGSKETVAQAKAVATNPDFQLFGRIHYAVHSAGIPGGTFDPISEANFADFKHLLEGHVHGTFLVNSYVSAAMKKQELEQASPTDALRGKTRGSIVNISSVSSFIAVPNMVQYTTCKHAMIGITKTAALDNASLNIRVNCICPTWTDTPKTRRATEVAPGLEEALLATIPMGRLGRPEEAADASVFLCSSKSSFTTGTSLSLDGGMTLGSKA